jgi:hypothetical protein
LGVLIDEVTFLNLHLKVRGVKLVLLGWCRIEVPMVIRSLVIAAFFVGIFFNGPDARARGGGGIHSGGIDGFQARGFSVPPHGGSFWRGPASHDFRFHGFVSHPGGSHGPIQHHHPDGPLARQNAGHWHLRPSFGDSRHSGSHGDGEWHIE